MHIKNLLAGSYLHRIDDLNHDPMCENLRDDPDFKEEVESYKNLMEMTLYREQADIEVAYYMEIPKKVLNRFGYTNKQLDEDLENAGIDGGYPY